MASVAKPKYIAEEEMLRKAKGRALTAAEHYANYERIVAEAEAEFPPDFPPLPKRGRPKAGSAAVAATPKSVRMESTFWDELSGIAGSKGLTVHAAMKVALIEYAQRERSAAAR